MLAHAAWDTWRDLLVGRKCDRRVHEIIKTTILYVGILPILAAIFADPTFVAQSDLAFCSIDGFDRQIKIVPGKNSGNVQLLVPFDAGIDPPRASF